MRIEDYKERGLPALRQATLCFLIRDDEILLAMKKRGFGIGRWNGMGGKLKNGEEIENAAIRETNEEVGVTPKNLKKKAVLKFYFPHHSDWSKKVTVYFSEKWEGEPSESEEMLPKWFKKNNLPFNSMWSSDIHWLKTVLEGKKIEAEFLFGEGDIVLDFKIKEVENIS